MLSADIFRLLISFANNLKPDQARHFVRPDLDTNYLTKFFPIGRGLKNAAEANQGRSYIYVKTQVRTHLDQKYGRFYDNADGFLMLCVQNNIYLSKSNFDRICDVGRHLTN